MIQGRYDPIIWLDHTIIQWQVYIVTKPYPACQTALVYRM